MSPKVPNPSIAEKLPIAVCEVNGKQFVSGLLWEKLDKVQSYMAEARGKAKDYGGLDIVAIRMNDQAVQAGFAPKRNGANKGLYSMAVVLASQFGDDFVAVLRYTEHQYVFVACSDGAILPGCDVVVAKDDAEAKLREYRPRIAKAAGQRKYRIVAPDEFGLESEELALEDVCAASKLRREYQLKPLAFGLSPKEMRMWVAIAVVVAGATFAGLYYKSIHDSREAVAAAERAKAAAIAEAKRMAGIQQGAGSGPTPTLPHPWLRSPDVKLMVTTCFEQMGKLPLYIAKWQLATAHCEFGAMDVHYTSEPSSTATVDDFKAAVHEQFGIEPVPALSDGLTVEMAPAFHTPAFTIKDGAPGAENPTKWSLISYFQAVGIDISLVKQKKPNAEGPQGSSKTPSPVQDWTTYDFAFKTTMPPLMLFEKFDLPTVRITSIEASIAPASGDLTWSYTGSAYVN